MHGPSQAVAQHAPWAQKPLAHSLAFAQGTPGPGDRHEPFRHTPGAHSGSAVQNDAQEVPPLLHLKGKQGRGCDATHVPLPLHVLGGVKTSPLHASAAQTEPTTYLRQPPDPSHLPSNPHVAGAVGTHAACGSSAPTATAVHRPTEAARLQLTQAPTHAPSQQTPSAHWAVAHSSLATQG